MRRARELADLAKDAIDARRLWLRRVLAHVRGGTELRTALFAADLEHEVDQRRAQRTRTNTWPAQEINA
jgi:hypothetical protein